MGRRSACCDGQHDLIGKSVCGQQIQIDFEDTAVSCLVDRRCNDHTSGLPDDLESTLEFGAVVTPIDQILGIQAAYSNRMGRETALLQTLTGNFEDASRFRWVG